MEGVYANNKLVKLKYAISVITIIVLPRTNYALGNAP